MMWCVRPSTTTVAAARMNEIEILRHHVAQLSLIHGWVPTTAQAITAVVLVCAVGWRSRRWRTLWLPAAVIVGVVSALSAHWYIASIGVAGDPAPRVLWMWIGLAGLAVEVLLAGWADARWWRRGLSVLAIPLCLLCSALALNLWVGYFPTVHTAWNQLTAGPLPGQVDRVTVTAMQLTGARPTHGVVVPVLIGADASGFAHRREFVYLPPAWFASNPPPRLPTVMMIGSALNTPADWLRAGNAVVTIDDFASAHGGNAPVLVFVDATGAFNNDTECVNGSRGNAAAHLTKDVVPYLISNFGVSADRANWGIAGWSMGGTCAVEMTVRHPEMFSAFVDIAGDLSPNTGTKEQTINQLFGGNADAWAAFDPITVITKHGHYKSLSAWFDIPGAPDSHRQTATPAHNGDAATGGHDPIGNPEGQDVAADSLCEIGRANGIRCAVVAQPGKHDWVFAGQAFAAALPWLAGCLGTPEVPRTPLPGATLAPASPTAGAPAPVEQRFAGR
jgi:S-formylglutathione hydrolase FrmB